MSLSTISVRSNAMPLWLDRCKHELIEPRKLVIENHPFVRGMLKGEIPPAEAEKFFSGLMWHLLDFGLHVKHLMGKRPEQVTRLLKGRSEDTDGDTLILKRIVEALGGPSKTIESRQWTYTPHRAWINHDALLRSAVYSPDFAWQVGTAALNVGIETLVPTMIKPLFFAATKNYQMSAAEAEWLESRSGYEEEQHGENGYILLSHFVDPEDLELQEKCRFFIDVLSFSTAHCLLESGLGKSSLSAQGVFQ